MRKAPGANKGWTKTLIEVYEDKPLSILWIELNTKCKYFHHEEYNYDK